ncbi:hypothetical protein [Rhodococcus ruber]
MKFLRRHIGRRVVVQLDDVVWAGTLAEAGPDHITLIKASAGITQPTAADGLIVIPALQIQFVQVPD